MSTEGEGLSTCGKDEQRGWFLNNMTPEIQFITHKVINRKKKYSLIILSVSEAVVASWVPGWTCIGAAELL